MHPPSAGFRPFVVCVEDDVASRHAAFDRIVVPELARLLGAARTLTRDRAAAEDLVQDAMLRAYRGLCRFDGRYPRAWLLTILRNAHLNSARRKRPLPVGEVPEAVDDQGGALDAVVLDDALRRALMALPDEQRDVVALVDIEGLTYQESADALGVPVGTIMSRLHRARTKLRAQLEAEGVRP
jgi:RNA polymerase sigma-70 factor (ECF subfamily)